MVRYGRLRVTFSPSFKVRIDHHVFPCLFTFVLSSKHSYRHVLVLTQLYVGHCLGVTHWRDRRHTTEMTMFGTLFKRVDSEFEVALRKPLMY